MTHIPIYKQPPRTMISIISPESIGPMVESQSTGGTFTSAAYPSANRAYFYPLTLDRTIIITKLWAANGGTATGNIDIGIYDDNQTKIVSTGSTAQSGTNTLQVIDITDTTIGPGRFYLAIATNSASSTLFRYSGSGLGGRNQFLGYFSQNTAFALPATATFASQASQYFPLFGLSTVITV